MSRIPPRFDHATFENFDKHTESQEAAAIAVQQWMMAAANGPMLALIGKQGTGKSHLFYAAVKSLDAFLSQRHIPLPFVAPWYDLADALRYGETIVTPGGSRRREPND